MERTKEEALVFENQLAAVREHQRKSKRTGDYHWRMANMFTGAGDYQPGHDDGEEPKYQ